MVTSASDNCVDGSWYINFCRFGNRRFFGVSPKSVSAFRFFSWIIQRHDFHITILSVVDKFVVLRIFSGPPRRTWGSSRRAWENTAQVLLEGPQVLPGGPKRVFGYTWVQTYLLRNHKWIAYVHLNTRLEISTKISFKLKYFIGIIMLILEGCDFHS